MNGWKYASVAIYKISSYLLMINILIDFILDLCWILFKAGGRLPSSVVTQDGRLQFNSISESDAGTYVCRARNNAGDSEARAEVIVNGKNIRQRIMSLNPMFLW